MTKKESLKEILIALRNVGLITVAILICVYITLRFFSVELVFKGTEVRNFQQSRQNNAALPHDQTNNIISYFCKETPMPDTLMAELELKYVYGLMLHWLDTTKAIPPQGMLQSMERFKSSFNELSSPESYIQYRFSDEYYRDGLDILYYSRMNVSRDTTFEEKVCTFLRGMSMGYPDYVDERMKEPMDTLVRNVVDYYSRLHSLRNKSYNSDNPVLLIAVKTMQIRYGSPRICFSNSFSPRMRYGARAYYIPSQNTIYLGVSKKINATEMINDWIAELSHSKQYSGYPARFMLDRENAEAEFLDSLVNIHDSSHVPEIKASTPDDVRQSIYDKVMYAKKDSIKGNMTIEREAHYHIEDEIRKELQALMQLIKSYLEILNPILFQIGFLLCQRMAIYK